MNILVLSPHTDDGEFGAGASLCRWIREGKHRIQYMAFCNATKSLPPGYEECTLVKELSRSMTVFGIHACALEKFEAREFPRQRQEILESMLAMRKTREPDTVLVPSTFDTHQDHAVIREESFRAFKTSTILGYEMPWNNLQFTSTAFVRVMIEDVERKIAAINCYKSQIDKNPIINEGLILGQARMRGSQIREMYAEAFEVIRWVM